MLRQMKAANKLDAAFKDLHQSFGDDAFAEADSSVARNGQAPSGTSSFPTAGSVTQTQYIPSNCAVKIIMITMLMNSFTHPRVLVVLTDRGIQTAEKEGKSSSGISLASSHDMQTVSCAHTR
jgi:hypothetical protein